MQRKLILALLPFICYLFVSHSYVCAQEYTSGSNQSETQGGRYLLMTVSKAATYAGSYGTNTRKTPAVVLDTYLGIIWRCKDIRDEKPMWIMNDLAKNTDKQPTNKKYVINIPAYTGEDYRIPAVVLDIETGKSWTCSNITEESANWVQVDLPKDIAKEGLVTTPY